MTACSTEPWTEAASREGSGEGMEASTGENKCMYLPESFHESYWRVAQNVKAL